MNKKQLKTVIIVCWILLAICFVIKIFGGNWFELSSDNEKFVQFCTFVDNTMWLKMILACVFQLLSGYLIISILLNKQKHSKVNILIYTPLLVTRSIISWFVPWITIVFDLLVLIIIPMIQTKKILKPIIVFGITLLLQVVSLFIRNWSMIGFNDNSTLLSLLMQIDYYIMLLLLYFYNFKFLLRKEDK